MENRRLLPYSISSVLLLCLLFTARSQDIHFSQFFDAPLLRNPSLAGIYTGDFRVQGVYRDQWNSVTNAYRTGSLNAEYKMPVGRGNDFITTGLQMVYDKAGTAGLTTTQFLPALNYHKSLSDEKTLYLSLGFMGGLVRRNVDMSKMTTNSQYNGSGFDPSASNGETFSGSGFTNWDASAGISLNTSFGPDQANSMFAGIAYHHLNRPENSFYQDAGYKLDPRYVFSSGFKFNLDDYNYFTIQADYSVQGAFRETIGGALYAFKVGGYSDEPLYTVHAGAFLRWKDALIPVLKLEMQPLSVAISYDINVSKLKTTSMGRGGFELSLTYIGFSNRGNRYIQEALCPRF